MDLERINLELSSMQTLTLRPHQKDHFHRVLSILSRFYFYIDGSEMGTGKTYIVGAASLKLNLPVIVICPNAARKVWIDVMDTYGIPRYNLPESGGVITYDSLRSRKGYPVRHGLLTRSDNGHTEFYTTPLFTTIVKNGVLLVFDECQKLKNASDQNKAAKSLIKQFYTVGGRSRIALLSGSIIDEPEHSVNFMRLVNFITSRNMYTSVNCEKRMVGIKELRDWAGRINPDAATEFIKNKGDPTNSTECTQYVFDIFIEIIKPGVMSIMPRPDTVGIKNIKNGFYTVKDSQAYKLAVLKLANSTLYNPETNFVSTVDMGAITSALIELQIAKKDILVRLAKIALSTSNYKVVLYADYYSVIDFIKTELAEYNPLELTGKIVSKKRDQNIALFQQDNLNHRLMIANPLVGGIAVSLNDTSGKFPRVCYIMPGYRVNENHQASGRFNRDGTVGEATIRFVYGKCSLSITENRILDALTRKGEVMKKVHSEQSEYGVMFPNDYESEYEPDNLY